MNLPDKKNLNGIQGGFMSSNFELLLRNGNRFSTLGKVFCTLFVVALCVLASIMLIANANFVYVSLILIGIIYYCLKDTNVMRANDYEAVQEQSSNMLVTSLDEKSTMFDRFKDLVPNYSNNQNCNFISYAKSNN